LTAVGRATVETTSVLERRPDGGAVRRTVLPGGLRVVTEQVTSSRSAAIGVWVGIGSRDETGAEAGAAHYLEHLLFKGTDRRTAASIAEEIDAVGGELNAFTSKEHTCYYAHVLDTDLALGLDVVCDVVLRARCDADHVDLERSVVLEEIAMRDDDPEDLLHEEFTELLLGDHPLAKPVLGTTASITAMTAEALRGFYRSRYTPPRTVIAVAGNVEHDRVVDLVRGAYGDLLAGDAAPVPPRSPNGTTLNGTPPADRLRLLTDDTEQAHLMLGVPGLHRADPRRYVLGVLNAALGGGMSSRLFQEVREKRGLAYSVYSATSSYSDTGALTVGAGCQPERLAPVIAVIDDVLTEVAADGFTDAEVARGKGQLRGGLVLGLEDTGSRMTRIGKGELVEAQYRTLDDIVDRIDAVTTDQVSDLARELLGRPRRAAVVGPFDDPGALPGEMTRLLRTTDDLTE
jgi:predicted Zn-dependent peptidase